MPPPTLNSEEPLNAPFGARCFLTERAFRSTAIGLNAPFGARCFLTMMMVSRSLLSRTGLNAPFGARCFLSTKRELEDTRN